MWAIIGGSGFENFEGFETLEELDRSTPFGDCSSGFKKVRVGGCEALFMSRHGSHHELLPSEVNFRANIYALKKLGASKIIAFSAVGSLEKNLKPGDMVCTTQYIDRTKSLRPHSFCGEGVVGHVSLAKPTTEELVEKLKGQAQNFAFDMHFGKTYVCIEGPYFSTKAESGTYRAMGAEIIGMTGFPEFALAREAGICYLPCCFVTDYDCWDDSIEHVTLQEVIAVMKGNNGKAFAITEKFLSLTESDFPKGCPELGLNTGLMTPWEAIPSEKKEWLSLFVER